MFCLLVSTFLALAAPPATAEVKVGALPFDLAALKTRPRVELKVKEQDAIVTYSGVPLAVVIEGQFVSPKRMSDLRALANAVILVRASDDYQVAVSAIEAATDPKGERYLIALELDGKPLGEGQGPAKLIVAAETEHVRWVRMIDSMSLVRLDSLRPKKTP